MKTKFLTYILLLLPILLGCTDDEPQYNDEFFDWHEFSYNLEDYSDVELGEFDATVVKSYNEIGLVGVRINAAPFNKKEDGVENGKIVFIPQYNLIGTDLSSGKIHVNIHGYLKTIYKGRLFYICNITNKSEEYWNSWKLFVDMQDSSSDGIYTAKVETPPFGSEDMLGVWCQVTKAPDDLVPETTAMPHCNAMIFIKRSDFNNRQLLSNDEVSFKMIKVQMDKRVHDCNNLYYSCIVEPADNN